LILDKCPPKTNFKISAQRIPTLHFVTLKLSKRKLQKNSKFSPYSRFSVLHTRKFHFLLPPSCVLCFRSVFNRRTCEHNPRKFGAVNYRFPPPVINAMPPTATLLLLLLLLLLLPLLLLLLLPLLVCKWLIYRLFSHSRPYQ